MSFPRFPTGFMASLTRFWFSLQAFAALFESRIVCERFAEGEW